MDGFPSVCTFYLVLFSVTHSRYKEFVKKIIVRLLFWCTTPVEPISLGDVATIALRKSAPIV